MSNFHEELRALINRYNKEGDSNTPDFILTSFLGAILDAYGVAQNERDHWFGFRPLAALESKKIAPQDELVTTLPENTYSQSPSFVMCMCNVCKNRDKIGYENCMEICKFWAEHKANQEATDQRDLAGKEISRVVGKGVDALIPPHN